MEIDRSIRAITPTTISGTTVFVSSGGGDGTGGGSVRTAISIAQSVVPGTITVPFPNVGTSIYGVSAYVIINGSLDLGIAKPRIPPDTDTRTSTSVQVIVYDTGILYTSIVLA